MTYREPARPLAKLAPPATAWRRFWAVVRLFPVRLRWRRARHARHVEVAKIALRFREMYGRFPTDGRATWLVRPMIELSLRRCRPLLARLAEEVAGEEGAGERRLARALRIDLKWRSDEDRLLRVHPASHTAPAPPRNPGPPKNIGS